MNQYVHIISRNIIVLNNLHFSQCTYFLQVSYEEFLSHFNYNETSMLLHKKFYNMDTNNSGQLLKPDMITAIKTEPELSFNAAKLLKILSNKQMGPIYYGEYVDNVATHCKK